MNNDEEVYMQLRNFQQQVGERIKVYYKCLLKLVNYLQMKAINVFLTSIFRTSLQPYLRLVTASMTKNTLIKHKEIVIICEESGLVIANYNILIIQP
jgi:hypothetical protein